VNQHKHAEDLHEGRGWLNRAAERLDAAEDSVSAAEFAYAAAVIANGFIGLAHAERALASMNEVSQVRQAILSLPDEPETTLGEAIAREKRAAAEARPHDDEPELPFLGFTADGHPVGGPVPDDVPRPALVARCGGPAICGACMDDAGDLRRAAREAGRG